MKQILYVLGLIVVYCLNGAFLFLNELHYLGRVAAFVGVVITAVNYAAAALLAWTLYLFAKKTAHLRARDPAAHDRGNLLLDVLC